MQKRFLAFFELQKFVHSIFQMTFVVRTKASYDQRAGKALNFYLECLSSYPNTNQESYTPKTDCFMPLPLWQNLKTTSTDGWLLHTFSNFLHVPIHLQNLLLEALVCLFWFCSVPLQVPTWINLMFIELELNSFAKLPNRIWFCCKQALKIVCFVKSNITSTLPNIENIFGHTIYRELFLWFWFIFDKRKYILYFLVLENISNTLCASCWAEN